MKLKENNIIIKIHDKIDNLVHSYEKKKNFHAGSKYYNYCIIVIS